MKKVKSPDDIWLIDGKVFIKNLLYSVNDDRFYYSVLTFGGDDLIFNYSKSKHEDIQYNKECEYWRSYTE